MNSSNCSAQSLVFALPSPADLGSFSLSQVYVFVGILALSNICNEVSKAVHRYDDRWFVWYMEGKTRIRRNVVSYYMQILITTIVLIFFCIYGVPLLFIATMDTPSQLYLSDIQYVVYFGIWLMTLYLWELAYKTKMNIALVIHHVSTLICICLAAVHYALTLQWFGMLGFVLLGLTALTEQPTFVALLLYRMEKWRSAANAFFISAVWTLFFKTLLVAALIYFWAHLVVEPYFYIPGNGNLLMWVIVFWPLLIPLYGSQIYSAVILFNLARVASKKAGLASVDMLYPSISGKRREVVARIESEQAVRKASMEEAHAAARDPELFDGEHSEVSVPMQSLGGQVRIPGGSSVSPRGGHQILVQSTVLEKGIF